MYADFGRPIRRRIGKRERAKLAFSGFGDLMSTAATLNSANVYTATVQMNEMFNPSDDSIKNKFITGWTGKYIDIVSLNRPYFSGRIQVIFKPKKDLKYTSLQQFLIQDLFDLGAEKAEILQIDSGNESSANVGGVQGAIQSATQEVSNIAVSAAKPLIPWVIGAGVLLIGYTWWKVGGLDNMLRPKQPNGVGRQNYQSERT